METSTHQLDEYPKAKKRQPCAARPAPAAPSTVGICEPSGGIGKQGAVMGNAQPRRNSSKLGKN